MKVIRTPRLILRPATADDAEFLAVLMNDPAYLRFIGDRGVRTAQDARHYLASALIYQYGQGLGLHVAETVDGAQPVGICGLVKRPEFEFADVGYAMLPGHAGKGYASEAASATLDHAFTDLGLPCILGITRRDNLGSRRVLEKIGMQRADLPAPGDAHRCVYMKRR